MAQMLMQHDVDPRDEIFDAIKPHLEGVAHLYHSQVLVATYRRPQQTKSGIMLPDVTRDEDEYQGKAGLVVKLGPMAFVDTDNVDFQGQKVEVGDWVVYRPSDGWPISIGPIKCRVLQDTSIKLRVDRPDLIW